MSQTPPRITNLPTLLTGLLKCGCCGASMTLATGKGGRYHYYKCNTRISKGNKLCDSRSIPMEKLDNLILSALADKVFDPCSAFIPFAASRANFSISSLFIVYSLKN